MTPGTAPRFVYNQGDHVCSLFLEPQDQLRAAVEYIKGGLERGERCLYVCCEHPVEEFRAALRAGGIDVEAEEARGALLIVTKEQGHLKTGCFDPDKMIELLGVAVENALHDGFKGLCAAGDMNWVLDEAPGTERLAEYEARLNRFYEASHALGLCLYNLKTLPPKVLDHCLATHKFVRIDGPVLLENPFYELPDSAARRIADTKALPSKLEWLRQVGRSA